MTDDTARAAGRLNDYLSTLPSGTGRTQALIDLNVILSARPSGLLREALATLLGDALTADHEERRHWANGVRYAVRVIEDAALAADEPGDEMCAVHTFVRLKDCEVHRP